MLPPAVLVAGGGPAGAAVAGELARAGFRVALCEPRGDELPTAGECLGGGARASLQRLGILSELEHDGTLAIASAGIRQCWDTPQPVERAAIFRAEGESWHVDRARFDRRLRELAISAGAEFLPGCSITAVKLSAHRSFEVGCRTGSEKSVRLADFIVDATGRTARVARLLGARVHRRCRTVALHTCGQFPCGYAGAAHLSIEATPRGWWYVAPLPGKKFAAGFITDADLLPRGAGRVSELLAEAPETRALLRDEVALLPWRVRAAGTSWLVPPVGEHWLAIGDAALAFDPLSSHGLSFALGSAIYAARAIEASFYGEGPAALHAFAYTVARMRAGYAAGLAASYHSVTRWPAELFWSRRENLASSSTGLPDMGGNVSN